jgi:hypothetical protein
LFEGAAKTFEVRRPDITGKAAERKSQGLEEKPREKDGVIAELSREVLALKKYRWPELGKAKMNLDSEITRLKVLTELPPPVPLSFAGIPERTFREWRGLGTKHNNNIPRGY